MLFGLCVFLLLAAAVYYFLFQKPLANPMANLFVLVVTVVVIVSLALWVRQTGVLGRI